MTRERAKDILENKVMDLLAGDAPTEGDIKNPLVETCIYGMATSEFDLDEVKRTWGTIIDDFYERIVKNIYREFIEPVMKGSKHERRMAYPTIYQKLGGALIAV